MYDHSYLHVCINLNLQDYITSKHVTFLQYESNYGLAISIVKLITSVHIINLDLLEITVLKPYIYGYDISNFPL